ncbi:hypothetical protein [Kitasatospora sp. DSM 101779]|uniref:hypothetical protein n=1 Tax=Kitasatospora sp. DSM 101779 TaxID=2853165 RepID=UPI0021D9A434|nr:hypothetical protein [Kitasatospora sp. DSM 101779]MCU7824220.1 hypothetical protein [Kitasatospora sp. DSM 101779]
MTAMSGAPWSVSLDYSHDAAFALAIRDALGIAGPHGLPPVAPPPELVVDPATSADEAGAAWQRWWDRILPPTGRGETGSPVLPDAPLDRVVTENFGALHAWSAARKREVARATSPTRAVPRIRDFLREYEQATGVRPAGFRLSVTALPVAGSVFLPLGGERIAVSIALLSDRAEYLRRILAHVGP